MNVNFSHHSKFIGIDGTVFIQVITIIIPPSNNICLHNSARPHFCEISAILVIAEGSFIHTIAQIGSKQLPMSNPPYSSVLVV